MFLLKRAMVGKTTDDKTKALWEIVGQINQSQSERSSKAKLSVPSVNTHTHTHTQIVINLKISET
jgi:hypothetical protein